MSEALCDRMYSRKKESGGWSVNEKGLMTHSEETVTTRCWESWTKDGRVTACLADTGLVLALSLSDALLEGLGGVKLGGGQSVALGLGTTVGIPRCIGDRALVGGSCSLQLVVVDLARVGVGALHALPIGRTGHARTL